jgi:hypothetical protein
MFFYPNILFQKHHRKITSISYHSLFTIYYRENMFHTMIQRYKRRNAIWTLEAPPSCGNLPKCWRWCKNWCQLKNSPAGPSDTYFKSGFLNFAKIPSSLKKEHLQIVGQV